MQTDTPPVQGPLRDPAHGIEVEISPIPGQTCGMHNIHAWTERTPEGDKREVRATKFGKRWQIQSKVRGEEQWTYHDPALLEDLRELREILFRKWQRRRASYEEVCQIEQMIKVREREEGISSPDARAQGGEPAS